MRSDDEKYEYGGIYENEADGYIDGDENEVFDSPEDDEDEKPDEDSKRKSSNLGGTSRMPIVIVGNVITNFPEVVTIFPLITVR